MTKSEEEEEVGRALVQGEGRERGGGGGGGGLAGLRQPHHPQTRELELTVPNLNTERQAIG